MINLFAIFIDKGFLSSNHSFLNFISNLKIQKFYQYTVLQVFVSALKSRLTFAVETVFSKSSLNL